MIWVRLLHLLAVMFWVGAIANVGALGKQAARESDEKARKALLTAAMRTNTLALAGAILALAMGLVMFFMYLNVNHYLKQPWMHGKLTAVIALLALQIAASVKLRRHAASGETKGAGLYVLLNAAGGPLAFLILFFVIVRPWEKLL